MVVSLLGYAAYLSVAEISYDPMTKYMNVRHSDAGGYRIVVWNTVTWEIVKAYGGDSIPALWTSAPASYSLGQNYLAHVDSQARWIDVINVADDTITHYRFKAVDGHGPVNVTWSGTTHTEAEHGNPFSSFMDEANKRLYVANAGGGRVVVLDRRRSRLIRVLTGFREPQGVAVRANVMERGEDQRA